MKNLIFIAFLFIAFAFKTNQTITCDKTALTSSCKKKLDPYKSDSQKLTKIA